MQAQTQPLPPSIDSIMQQPVIGVYPINIHNAQQATDGGACKFSKEFIKTFYLNGHGQDTGYYIPGGYFLSFKSFSGGHQIWLDNFQFKKGLVYTISYYLRTNSNKNPWNNGAGKVASDKAMFNINCRQFVPGMLQIGKSVLSLTVNDHTPELKKYVSGPYAPQKDQLVSIIIHPWLYDRNGFLWDVAYPEIQWRVNKAE